ncbi:hypothetical protein F5Y01DRAFT_322806 [Xylaria sp. FL0043]|nr:hypothetical protein F5Y01DRAFT_322806 [Xylaria sp. FL0043]
MINRLLHFVFSLLLLSAFQWQTVNAALAKRAGDVPACPSCSASTPGCASLPTSGEDTCPAGLQSRDFVEDLEDASFGALIVREDLEKRSPKGYKYQTSTGATVTLNAASYPSCGDAVKYPDISRWFGYDSTQQKPPCTPDIVMNTGKEAFFQPSDYATEHVFEGNTLLLFINWLWNQGSLGKAPSGYTMPSQKWVEYYLLGPIYGGGYYSFPSGKLGPKLSNKDYFWNYMVRGLGDSVNRRELVLAHDKMNGVKGKLFAMEHPPADRGSMDSTVAYTKNLVGVFNYLGYSQNSKTEALWNKFLRPSNWVDLACSEFDAQYAKDRGNKAIVGEPTYTNPTTKVTRQGSMRWLWKAFIDATLADIETFAAAWCADASKLFVADSKNPKPKYYTPSMDRWVTAAFGKGGFCTAPKLPRPAGTGSTYGAWGNNGMTQDWDNRPVTLPQPTP